MSGRFAVGAYFFLHGVVSASSLYTTAMFTSRSVVNPGSLGQGLTIGLVMLLSVALVPVGMPLGAWLAGQVGMRRVAVGAAVTGCLVLGGSAFAGSVGVLAVATGALGLVNGALLVAMNTMAAGIERDTGRLLLPWCHGWFALGGLAGGVLAVQPVLVFVPLIDRLLWTAAISLVLAVGFAKLLPDADLPDTRPRLPRNFVLLAAVVFAALTAANVMRSLPWRFEGIAATGIPAAAFTLLGAQAFSLGMAVGGFAGGLVAARIGLRNLQNASAGITVIGLVWLNLSPTFDIAAAGFLITGVGLSCVFPVMLSLAAKEGSARHAIAAVAAAGYIAAQEGAYLFGLLGSLLDLRYSLACLLLVPVVVAAAGAVVTSSDRAGA